ncbi:alpha/beta hydrolase fold domain-containing protein [Variovorax sp. VNK109]|uniref:alpha/beta hydrolase fold domain-containing protein n=1 Tax=Variovorax sp. VNK109 TaxID=3400919 RepID=UPI003C077C5E
MNARTNQVSLDPDLARFFQLAHAQLGPSVTDLARRRERYDRIAELAGAPAAPDTVRRDFHLDAKQGHRVALRLYTPAQPVSPLALYLHGGGWSAGGIASHDALCGWLAHQAGVELAAVDYRLSPEHAHPAALEDAETALYWALAQKRPVLLLGDSAGAHLAAAAALRATLHGQASGLAWLGLIYPAASPNAEFPSHHEHAQSAGLSRGNLLQYWEWFGGVQGRANTDPHFDLLQIRNWHGLPPTHILSAELDPLRDEAQALAGIMSASGINVTLRCAPAMPHGFARFVMQSNAAMQEMKGFARALQRSFGNCRESVVGYRRDHGPDEMKPRRAQHKFTPD